MATSDRSDAIRIGRGSSVPGHVHGTQDIIADHGLLSGRGDDDHQQYHNDARGDLRYPLKQVALANPTSSAEQDWNSVQTAGWHSTLMLGSWANGPGVGGYYYLQVLQWSSVGGSITQIAYPYRNSGTIRWRDRYSGAWTPWYSAAREDLTMLLSGSHVKTGNIELQASDPYFRLHRPGVSWVQLRSADGGLRVENPSNGAAVPITVSGPSQWYHAATKDYVDKNNVHISGAHMVWPSYKAITTAEPSWTPYWPGVRFAMPAGVWGWVRATVAGYTYVKGGSSSGQGALFGLDLGLWGETAGDGSSAWSNGNATAVGRLTAPPNTELRTSYIAQGWRYHYGNGDMFIVPVGTAIGSLVAGGSAQFGLCRATLEFYPGTANTISASTF